MDFTELSFLAVKFGESVSLKCPLVKANSIDRVAWFKQTFGEMPRIVGGRATYKGIQISPKFNMSQFKIETVDGAVSLTIPHMKRDDAGLYFCGILGWEAFRLSNGTFLAVKGN